MFSDDTSSSPCECEQADRMKSLPVIPSSNPASCCCSKQCSAGQAEEEGEAGLFSSSSALPSNHYKSPHEVDGEYSYAYR